MVDGEYRRIEDYDFNLRISEDGNFFGSDYNGRHYIFDLRDVNSLSDDQLPPRVFILKEKSQNGSHAIVEEVTCRSIIEPAFKMLGH